MLRRCTNPKCDMFYAYGGRGVKVCDRWLDKDTGFINFYNDMGKRPVDENGKPYQIDRIDNNGDYCPENCRWASSAKNAQNKRNNVMFLINGEEMCLASVAKLFGFSRDAVRQRMKRTGEDKYSALFSILSNKGYNLSPLTKGKDML